MRLEEPGQAQPGRRAERRPAPVGDQPPARVGDGQLHLAVRPDAVPLCEPAVADVQRSRPPAEVAEDVGPRLAIQEGAQLGEHDLELGLVGRVDGDELPAGPAVCVLGVAKEQELQAPDELEWDAPGDAVVPHAGEDSLRVVQAGRCMDLPPLQRQAEFGRPVHEPVVELALLPAIGHLAASTLEVHVIATHPQEGFVEEGISEAIDVVPVVQLQLPPFFVPADRRHFPNRGWIPTSDLLFAALVIKDL